MAKKTERPASTEPQGLFAELAALQGNAAGLNAESLDARLLWKVVQILALRGASIQIGTTRDRSAWSVQYWDGQYPVKNFFQTTDALNTSLAALVRADGKKELSEEWEEIVRSYGW